MNLRIPVLPRFVVGLAATIALSASVMASSDTKSLSLEERIKGADAVVIASTRSISSRWQQNAHGDRLIVSRVLLDVEETLKGRSESQVWIEVDGGTLDGLTLRVSGQAALEPGDRAVVIMDPVVGGVRKPHLRGQGVLKLDASNVLRGSSIHLDDVRNVALRVGR